MVEVVIVVIVIVEVVLIEVVAVAVIAIILIKLIKLASKLVVPNLTIVIEWDIIVVTVAATVSVVNGLMKILVKVGW